MSYHSSFQWTFEDEVCESLISEICEGLEKNKEYNNNGKFMMTYSTMCLMDNILLNTGRFLDDGDFKEESIIKRAEGSPDPKKYAEILRLVSKKFGYYGFEKVKD